MVLKAIGDPKMGVIEPSKAAKPLRPAAEIRANLAGESTAGMAGAVLESLAAAERGFSHCANKLRGTVIHELREATWFELRGKQGGVGGP